MEKKFSKGKWRISNSGAFIESENGVIAAISLSAQENINNAKLIAAAPDMLEALEYIIESINPIDACRGKFETLGKDTAYVGSRNMPTEEAILRCIETIKKATE